MSKILLNTITVGTQIHYSGNAIPAELQAGVTSAGGQLVDSAVYPAILPLAALAVAERAQGRHKNAEQIMEAGASAYVVGAIQSISTTFTAAGAVAAGAVTTLDQTLGVLPTNARVLSVSLETETGFDDATHSTFAVTCGTAAGGNQIATTTSVNAAASGFPKVGPVGAGGYLGAAQGGATISARLTGGVNLSTVTAGAVTVKLFYFIAA